MSKITLEPNSSGAGTFSIQSPDSNSNRVLTLPDNDGTVATVENLPPGYEDQDALDLFNATGSAPVYACRAWVNFDGTGTVSIRESGNVSSITDNATGDYTVNFTTAMPDANYSSVVSISNDVGFSPQVVAVNNKAVGGFGNIAPTTSAFRFYTNRASDGAAIDELYISASVFR